MLFDFLTNWLAAVPGFVVPFALAALGLLVIEKAGVLSLGAEGFMLVGALAGIGAILGLGASPPVALLCAALAAAGLSLLFAVLVVSLRVNQVIAGLSLVFLAQGLTGLVGSAANWVNRPVEGLRPVPLPNHLTDLPILGLVLFRQDLVVYLTFPIFALVAAILTRTMIGLRLRAVGDGPDAADAAGVSVAAVRYGAIMVGASLVGIAGGYLSVGIARIWVEGMTGGRGWIAIAIVIFARWQPGWALAGAILFGAIEALIPRIAAAGIQVPQYFIAMIPYLATLAVMIWTCSKSGGRSMQPRALGLIHLRENR